MFDLPWSQMSGAALGGLVGSFSGFIANSVHESRARRQVQQNIASALIGEISALCHLIESTYIALVDANLHAMSHDHQYKHHHFRGERDYMPVFRGIGGTIGHLPKPLPRELVFWYTTLALMLERARAMHDLASQRNPDLLPHVIELAEIQQRTLTELIAAAKPLLERLERI
jgi:hypothetical protein